MFRQFAKFVKQELTGTCQYDIISKVTDNKVPIHQKGVTI